MAHHNLYNIPNRFVDHLNFRSVWGSIAVDSMTKWTTALFMLFENLAGTIWINFNLTTVILTQFYLERWLRPVYLISRPSLIEIYRWYTSLGDLAVTSQCLAKQVGTYTVRNAVWRRFLINQIAAYRCMLDQLVAPPSFF